MNFYNVSECKIDVRAEFKTTEPRSGESKTNFKHRINETRQHFRL